MATTDLRLVRAGVCYHRTNLHPSPVIELFMGDGQPSRFIGVVVFSLLAPPFKHRTVDKETLSPKIILNRIRYVMPSSSTVCYLVAPNWAAIQGAKLEHDEEQRLDSPAWGTLIDRIYGGERPSDDESRD